MKFEYSRYTLRPLTLAGGLSIVTDREGALIRVTWPNGSVGYGDLMPRPEFGDARLEIELEQLKNFKLSILAEQTIAHAKIDSQIRNEKRNAFKGSRKVRNNFLIADPLNNTGASLLQEIKRQNFSSVLIDCGQDFERELEIVKRVLKFSAFMVRLDFNGKGNLAILERFSSQLDANQKARIEFIKDFMPFEPTPWKEAAKLFPLAVERDYNKVPWEDSAKMPTLKYLLLRPSRMDVPLGVKRATQNKMKIAIASSLEHPVSIAHATLVASNLIAQNPVILGDHDSLYQTYYAPHSFTGTLRFDGPYMITTEGHGIGFDFKFRSLPWVPLK